MPLFVVVAAAAVGCIHTKAEAFAACVQRGTASSSSSEEQKEQQQQQQICYVKERKFFVAGS